MKGYIKNVSNLPKYIFKTHVLPGDILKLEDIYNFYVASEKQQVTDEKFKAWLKSYIKDPSVWEIVFISETKEKKPQNKKDKGIVEVKKKPSAPVVAAGMVKKDFSPEEIASFTIAQAREQVPKIKDKRLLKQAVKIASTRPRKDLLCKMLYKRIEEITH